MDECQAIKEKTAEILIVSALAITQEIFSSSIYKVSLWNPLKYDFKPMNATFYLPLISSQ